MKRKRKSPRAAKFTRIRVYKTARLHEWKTDSRPEEPVKPNLETVRTLVKEYRGLVGKVVSARKRKDGTYFFTYSYYRPSSAALKVKGGEVRIYKTKRRRAK